MPLFVPPPVITKTITPPGTTGNRTINSQAGSVNFGIGEDTLIVTNSLCTSSSILMANVATNDDTLTAVRAVPSNGSFMLVGNAAATSETRVSFCLVL